MPRKSKAIDPIASAWERIEGRPGVKASLAPALAEPSQLDGAFAYVFDFGLPDGVRASYERHDGERSKAVVCPPLRLVSAQEALAFAEELLLLGQEEPSEAVTAYQRLSKRYARSMEKQGLHSSSEDAARWTLALGSPGHRIAVDCEAEWVIEERPDGSVVKLADDFASWLVHLGDSGAPAEKAGTGKAPKPIDKWHAKFLAALGPPVAYRDVDAKAASRCEKAHPWLGKLVGRDGLASYGEKLVWTCDPADFVELASVWKEHGKWLDRFEWSASSGKTQPGLDGEVIARSAFGHVFLLTRKQGLWRADPEDGVVRSAGIVGRDGKPFLQGVFEGLTDRSDTAVILGSPKELREAAKKHGPLEWNEAYFWNTKKAHHTECAKRELVPGTRRALGVKR